MFKTENSKEKTETSITNETHESVGQEEEAPINSDIKNKDSFDTEKLKNLKSKDDINFEKVKKI